MRLFEGFFRAIFAADKTGRIERHGASAFEMPKQVFSKAHDHVVIDRAGCGEHHVFRAIMFGHEPGEILAPKGAHTFFGTKDGPADGLIRVGAFLKPIKDHIVGRIERLPDFLQDTPRSTSISLWSNTGLRTISPITSSASATSFLSTRA